MDLFLLDCFLRVLPQRRCLCDGSLGIFPFASSPCRFLTVLGLVLPLAGTVYVAARRWASDHRASPAHDAHSATYGSLPVREMERSERRDGLRWAGGLAHLLRSGALSGGESRHFNKRRALTRGDLDGMPLENNSCTAGVQ